MGGLKMIKQLIALIAVGFLSACSDSIDAGRGGASDAPTDPSGMYKNVMSNGGPGFQIIDETPEGQLFLTRDPFLFVAPDVAGSVMVFNATSGIVFVGNVGARQAFVGNGTISGTGIAYAPPIVNGGRVSLLFANGRTAAPASMTGEYAGKGHP
jgi:hypothetical protein